MEIKITGKQEWTVSVPIMILLVVLLLELFNAYAGWWMNGFCIKVVFCVIFIFMVVEAIRTVCKNYQASIRAKELESELKDSQLTLAFSQIHPHFLYNTLATISVLCQKEPSHASEAMNVLAKYLRVNLDSVDRTIPISFSGELNHVRTYLWLEKCASVMICRSVMIWRQKIFICPYYQCSQSWKMQYVME